VGENEMSLLTGGEQSNFVRGDDLKVRPTKCIGSTVLAISGCISGCTNLSRGAQFLVRRTYVVGFSWDL